MKKKNEGPYTVEREFLGKLSAEELLGRIIQAHTTYKKEETPPVRPIKSSPHSKKIE